MVFSNAPVAVNAPAISEKRVKRFSMHSGIHTVADHVERKGGNNMIGGVCSCQEIERIIDEKLQQFLASGMVPKGTARKKREPSERTPRQQFMSDCMRSPEKGGQGKGMAVCAQNWKQKK